MTLGAGCDGGGSDAGAAQAQTLDSSWSMEQRNEKPIEFLREVAARLVDLSSSPSPPPSSREQLKALLEAACAFLGGTITVPPDSSSDAAAAAAAAAAGFAFVSAAAEVVRSTCVASLPPSDAADDAAVPVGDVVETAIEALSRAAGLSAAWHARALGSAQTSSEDSRSSSSSSSCLAAGALDATASTARAIDASFFCVRWLDEVGQEGFTAASAKLRAALKDSLAPAAAAALSQRRTRRSKETSSPSPSLARLGETVEALTSLGVRASVAVRGGRGGAKEGGSPSAPSPPSSLALPLPMRSFALINVAVLGASRLLSAVAENENENDEESGGDQGDRELIRSAALRALAALSGPTAAAASDLARARGEADLASKLTPVRFWAQHVLKLAAAHPKGCVMAASGGERDAEEAGRRFAGALVALAGAEAELSLRALSSSSPASSTPLAAAKGVISKTAAAVAACWASQAAEESARAGAGGAAASALAALLEAEDKGADADAHASALVLLLQASSSSSCSSFSSNLVSRILPELSRRVSRGERALRDSAWRDGAASAVAAALAASAAVATAAAPSSLWPSAERALFEAALECPTPAARELVGEAWAGAFRALFRRAKASASSTDAVAAVLETHASALAAAAAGAAAVAAASYSSSPQAAPPNNAPHAGVSCSRADAEALSEHLALLAARVLSAFPAPAPAAPTLRIACGLLEEADEALGVAQGRPEAAAAAAAVVKVAATVAASRDPLRAAAASDSSSSSSSFAEAAERDLRAAAGDLLLRASADLLAAAELRPLRDLEGALLLVEALCAGCSASFDEGGFENNEGPKNGENERQRGTAGLLGLARSRVEEVASRVVSVGPVALLSSDCRSAALRALAATGLPPLPGGSSKRSRGNNRLAPPRPQLPDLLLPASMAEGSREDPRVAAAASALAPLVAAAAEGGGDGGGGGGGGNGNGVEALYRALLARAAASSSSSSPSSSSSSPCFVALYTTAASLVAHARVGGGDVRSCVPSEMLPQKKKVGDGTGGEGAAAAAETWPFLEIVKAIMKREAPATTPAAAAAAASPSSSARSAAPAALLDASALSAALQGAASRVSSRAAALAAAAIDDKVRQALASLREVEAAAEAVGGGGGVGVKEAGCSAAALDEVAAAAQRLKRRCV